MIYQESVPSKIVYIVSGTAPFAEERAEPWNEMIFEINVHFLIRGTDVAWSTVRESYWTDKLNCPAPLGLNVLNDWVAIEGWYLCGIIEFFCCSFFEGLCLLAKNLNFFMYGLYKDISPVHIFWLKKRQFPETYFNKGFSWCLKTEQECFIGI